jgi:2-haloacid dehalogenase
MLVNFCGDYGTYEETTRDALEYALAAHDEELSADDIDDIMGVFYELDVFEDVRPGMETIDEMGYDIRIASNGNEALLEAMVQRAAIDDLVEDTISANELEVYKPDIRFYQHVSDRVGTDPSDIAHVATPWYDVCGAMNAGMQAVWVNRGGRPWDEYDGSPDATVGDFDGLVDVLRS